MIKCGRCGEEMREVMLPRYEFEDGITVRNVTAMRCKKGHITFTEEQAIAIEQRTEDIKKHIFKFKRTLSKSGRSLVMRIPADLVKHLRLNEKSVIEVIPIDKKKFIVEVK